MTHEEVKDIIACLPKGKTSFTYHKDKYALFLLQEFVGPGKKVSTIKTSAFRKLLQKPALTPVIRRAGGGVLHPELLSDNAQQNELQFLLTAGEWQDWQTSLRDHNLVLQLNFSTHVYQAIAQLLERSEDPFSYSCHPIAREGYFTLAWARLDVDLATGEAIIEEIQSDWMKEVRYCRELMAEHEQPSEKLMGEIRDAYDLFKCEINDFVNFMQAHMQPLEKIWAEAMLAATLWFLIKELGVRRIFYHEYESSIAVKRVDGGDPPRSIYTNLPARFCFVPVKAQPHSVVSSKKRHIRWLLKNERLKWQMLDLSN